LKLLANDIKAAVPGLIGYFGVDLLLDTQTARGVTIVEVNPRLTTSYVHLHQAIGCNPAAMVMDAMLAPTFSMPDIKREQIEFYV
jgi:predicted ATP-grasp superfamily ATP-dependent carboligase